MIIPVLPPVETITIIATSKWSIKNNAKQEELREEAFVYMYRYWLRVLLGDYKTTKKIENEIFGSTDFGPKVKIQVVNNTRGKREDVLAIGDKVTIKCVYAAGADKESVHPLLVALTKVVAFLGGVGGKTARGFGCFRMQTDEEPTSKIEGIENSLNNVYKILDKTFGVTVKPTVIVDIVNNTITLSGQTDVNEKYPFLRKVKILLLNRKKINFGFTEIKKNYEVVGGQKVYTLRKVFGNEYNSFKLQFFGSLKPRYTSPITVSVHPILSNHAVLCMFQSSYAGRGSDIHSQENMNKVFDQTCKSYE